VVEELKIRTFQTGKEHAVVKLASGERAIVSGGQKSISFTEGSITRIFGHTHSPYLNATGPSVSDFATLERLGQTTSYLLEHGDLYKYSSLAGGSI